MNQLEDKSHHIWYNMILSWLGGMMDAYSYVVRGGVFATGQTGNFIFFIIGIANQDRMMILKSIIPMTAFCLGVFVTQYLFHFSWNAHGGKITHRNIKGKILIFEAVCMIIVGVIPNSVNDSIPNMLISFTAAMQFCSFPYFEDHRAYASVFVTGDMKSCIERYYEGIILRKAESRRAALQYTYILLSFFGGAYLVIQSARYIGEKTIWGGAILALICSKII